MSATVTSTVQEIPLRMLTTSSTGQDDLSDTEQHDGSGSSEHTAQVIDDRVAGDSSLPAGSRSSTNESSVTTAAQRPERRDSHSETNAVYRFLVYTPVGNAIGILALFLALAFGLFTGISTYMDMKWSEHNDAVETCVSLYNIGHFSRFCNDTIAQGVEPTPLIAREFNASMASSRSLLRPRHLRAMSRGAGWKLFARNEWHAIIGPEPLWTNSNSATELTHTKWTLPEYQQIDGATHPGSHSTALHLAGALVCTTGAILLGIIVLRPRMRLFAPFISHCRLEVPKWMPGFRFFQYISGFQMSSPLNLEPTKKGTIITWSECNTDPDVCHEVVFHANSVFDEDEVADMHRNDDTPSVISSSDRNEDLLKSRILDQKRLAAEAEYAQEDPLKIPEGDLVRVERPDKSILLQSSGRPYTIEENPTCDLAYFTRHTGPYPPRRSRSKIENSSKPLATRSRVLHFLRIRHQPVCDEIQPDIEPVCADFRDEGGLLRIPLE